MCGIVGYVGDKNASELLYKGLQQLEYRGYDSVGIAVLNDKNKIDVVKKMGRVSSIECSLCDLKGNVGIGHTRWATHGKPSDINAHPHIKNRFGVVHNGIIENFNSIKENILTGENFVSETDSEIIAWLLDKNYNGNLLETLKKTLDMLEGSFALAVICEEYPDTIAVARHNNPLVVGHAENESFVASDCPALTSVAKEIYIMQDDELALIKHDNIEFFDIDLKPLIKHSTPITCESEMEFSDVPGYFMNREINEIPTALRDTYSNFFYNIDLKEFKDIVKSINKITIFGCGTAYHSGVVAKYVIESLARIPVNVEIASEFRYQNPIMQKDELFIAVSQSGETADTIAAAKMVHQAGLPLAVITNVFYSSITNYAEFVFATQAKTEIGVAATKSYCSQLEMFYMLALTMKEVKCDADISVEKQVLKNLPNITQEVLDNNFNLKKLAQAFADKKSIFFIGRQLDYAVALESSLKLKEISYVHSEGYPAGELKHGTIALIDDNAVVFAIITQKDISQKTLNAIHEVRARGATVVLITSLKEYSNLDVVDYTITVPEVDKNLMPMLSIIPLQKFAYEMALLKGNNPDKPRNLAKSVTVE